ncbi:MAG: hypothetical protein FJZ58_00385 [Chlamydiae bacterium]|nr:hypothetical protein [Chlamydiota bacterium]
MIPHIQAQYRDLQENYTLNLPDMTLPPCALIYNIDTLLTDGYIIQEKVLPFSSHSPLWNETTPWDTLSTLQLGYLSQLRDLFHYSFTSHKPGLDLKWDNLGVRSEHKESLVLFDFYEFDDEFYLNAKGFLHDLSQGNPAIRDFLLEGLQDKCNSILIIDPIGSFPAFSQDTILWFPKDEKEMARYKTLRSLLIDRAAHLAV